MMPELKPTLLKTHKTTQKPLGSKGETVKR